MISWCHFMVSPFRIGLRLWDLDHIRLGLAAFFGLDRGNLRHHVVNERCRYHAQQVCAPTSGVLIRLSFGHGFSMQRLTVARLAAHGLPLVVLDAEAVEHIANQRLAGVQGGAKGDLSRLGQKFFSRRHIHVSQGSTK